MDQLRRAGDGLRILLALGGAVCIGAGLTGLFWSAALRIPLGAAANGGVHARLLGAFALSCGAGYVVAAIDPRRHRGLVAVLFSVPIFVGIALSLELVAGDISRVQAAVLLVADLAYALLFFRMYPQERRGGTPANPSTPEPPEPAAIPPATAPSPAPSAEPPVTGAADANPGQDSR